jgi:MFS family permease
MPTNGDLEAGSFASSGNFVAGAHPKRIALSVTTLGTLMVTINQSILLVSLPALFRGIKLNPLVPSSTSYFLWVFMGFSLVIAVLVVSLGRVGDIYGRVRMYNLGFAVFTVFSILLSVTFLTGSAGALWIIIMRVFQGVGGAFLLANSTAILTGAIPPEERGRAIGINSIAAVSGSFIGLILGGVLAPIEWRLVFLVSVPFGVFGTIWAHVKLVDNGVRVPAKIDWLGNTTFAAGLIALLTGIVYSLLPYGGHPTGWTNPWVLTAVFGGLAILTLFVWIELRVPVPMFRLGLFRSRAFTAGNIAGLLDALGRGGLQFVLIIWLQGIWLPQHGYSFDQTPLWAGVYMIPLTLGFVLIGPISGILSDRYGPRLFATSGLIVSGVTFVLLELLPVNFSYIWFGLLIFLFAVGTGLFFSPNLASAMNNLPPRHRGAGAGMLNTFQNSASVLSMGLFLTIVTLGLAADLPSHVYKGLVSAGVAPGPAHIVASKPPIGSLFSAFLGYNPIKELLGPTGALSHLSASQAAHITGRSFFPQLIEQPFADGIHLAFTFAAIVTAIAVVASALRGPRHFSGPEPVVEELAATAQKGTFEPGKVVKPYTVSKPIAPAELSSERERGKLGSGPSRPARAIAAAVPVIAAALAGVGTALITGHQYLGLWVAVGMVGVVGVALLVTVIIREQVGSPHATSSKGVAKAGGSIRGDILMYTGSIGHDDGEGGGGGTDGGVSFGDRPPSRYLKGQCPDRIPVGEPFSLLVSIVLTDHDSAKLKPFDVPAQGRDVLVVAHAPGLRFLSRQRMTIRVPAGMDSDPVMFELRADRPGPWPLSITAWLGGTYLGELSFEVTSERDSLSGTNRDVFAEINTESITGTVSLVVRYDPRQNTYRFEFRDEDNPEEVMSNLAYEPRPRVEQLVAELDEIAKARTEYSVAQTRDYLINAGAGLWRELIPERLRQQFWERQHRIRRLTILADKDAVPWELLYPMDPGHDAGFLVEQFPVTRAVFGRAPTRRLSLEPARFVLPEGSPPKAYDEVEAVRRLLDCKDSAEGIIDALTPLQDLISSGDFGLLHFACHNRFDPVDGSSIEFEQERKFTPTFMNTAAINHVLADSAPTIFINACRSAGLTATYNRLDGWASKFLEAGAAVFIGSLWAVADATGREFASELYTHLQRNASLGEALLSARRAAATKPGDPTWLAYTVYGDPNATISQR